jgi:small GTP-binding protein
MAVHHQDKERQTRAQVLNANQQSPVATRLRYVDELLSEALRKLSAGGEDSPFSSLVHDATPVQQKVAADYVRRVRAAMRAVLEKWGIDPSPLRVSAVWAARTTLYSAEIAVEELAPHYLRGYGELSDEAAKEVNAVVSELLDLLGQLESYLAQGSTRDLRARLERFEQRAPDVRMVSELEGMITAHGLVELRATLEAITERLESNTLEVAVFGRVSCGKSSLLNHLLKTHVLPVGIKPVTTFPLRITYGAEPWGRVWFTDAAPQLFDLGRLAEFAAEQFNPSNARHVTRINVELPAPLLKDGVAFVDTPGLGSLATAGAAESMAYLPRCDVGIVLVDAASTLTPEDVTLVDALYRAGAKVMVVVSKADLLQGYDWVRAVAYVADELEARTGTRLLVHPVSVRGHQAMLCDHWRESVLLPVLRDHQQLARKSLQHKISMLQHAVTTVLERRLRASERPNDAPERGKDAGRILSQALAQLDAAVRSQSAETSGLARYAAEILDEAAHNAAVIWNQHHEPETTIRELLAASLKSRAGGAATTAVRDIIKLRAVLNDALAKAAVAGGISQMDDDDGLPMPTGMPYIDGAAVIPPTILRKPALAFAGTFVLRRSARRQLAEGALESTIQDALAQYEKQLQDWRKRALEELRRQFVAKRDLLCARFDESGSDFSRPARERAVMQEDLEKLKRLDAISDAEGKEVPEPAYLRKAQ